MKPSGKSYTSCFVLLKNNQLPTFMLSLFEYFILNSLLPPMLGLVFLQQYTHINLTSNRKFSQHARLCTLLIRYRNSKQKFLYRMLVNRYIRQYRCRKIFSTTNHLFHGDLKILIQSCPELSSFCYHFYLFFNGLLWNEIISTVSKIQGHGFGKKYY